MALLTKLGIKPLEVEVPKKEEHLETHLMDSIIAEKEGHLYYDAASKNS